MVFLTILSLFLCSIFTRVKNGTWLTPAGINNLLWCFFLTGAWIFQEKFLTLHPMGVFIIFIFCLSFSVGSLPFNTNSAARTSNTLIEFNKERIQHLYLFLCKTIVILSLFQLLLIPVASLLSFNIPLSYYYHPVSMIFIGLKVRFDPAYVTSNLLNLLIGINFGSFFIIGAFLALRSILKRKVSLFTLIGILILLYLGLMLVFMYNAKSSMIVIFTMTISGYLALNVCLNPDPAWFKKQIGFFSIALISMFLVFILMISARYSTGDAEVIRNTLITYGFGHTYCFDNFIALELDDIIWPEGFGIHSMYSLAKIFGYRLPEGVYEDKLVFINGSESNVYTFLRGYIYDFGVIGFPLVTLFLSYGIHYCFEKVVQESSLWFAALISLVFQFILFSAFISPLVYMNITVGYLVFPAIFWYYKITSGRKYLEIKESPVDIHFISNGLQNV